MSPTMRTGPEPAGLEVSPERAAEIEAGLRRVSARVAAACAAAGRSPQEIELVAVTKRFPAGDAAALVRLGVRAVGESRDQEAAPKIAALRAGLGEGQAPVVHAIGQVQTNKAGSVARWADVVHSVDRDRLVSALARARAGAMTQSGAPQLEVLLQVDLEEGRDPGRGGASPAALAALADQVEAAEGLRLRGLMAVAPRGQDPARAFARLAGIAARLRADHPGATWLSAGMSGDLEAAVACGATHLRVGSAILGSRQESR